MQGQGHVQPVQRPPHDAVLVLLRVVFVALGVFSVGFLAWVMMLRLATVTRRSADYGLLVAVAVADVLSIVLLATEPGDDVHTPGGYLGITLLFGVLLATVVYYLAADVRHFQRRREAYAAQTAAQAYGYPPPASPYTTATTPLGTPPPHTVPPVPRPPVSQLPIPAPPQRPAPARIEQVRAELDELSDYLRKHDGRNEGGR